MDSVLLDRQSKHIIRCSYGFTIDGGWFWIRSFFDSWDCVRGDREMKGLLALVMVIIGVIVFAALLLTGVISIPGVETPTLEGLTLHDEETHPDAEYCGFSDLEIHQMIELIADKDLNNQAGLGFVDALNMQACGVNEKTTSQIMSYYTELYSDYYTYYDDTDSGAGYTVRLVIWTDEPDAVDSTFAKSIAVYEGTTVENAYGYDLLYLRSEGTVLTYAAFLNWIASS